LDEEVFTRVIKTGVGELTESDLQHSSVAKASILAFNVPMNLKTQSLLKDYGVPVFHSPIIYEILDQLKEHLASFLSPILTAQEIGRAHVQQVFKIEKKKGVTWSVAGCTVMKGKCY
jgi:translation initiation factor IF-2